MIQELRGQGAALTSALINKLKTMVSVPLNSHRVGWISAKAYNFLVSQGFAYQNYQRVEAELAVPNDKYVDGGLIWSITEDWPDDIILLTNGRDHAILIDYVLDPQIEPPTTDTK